MECKNKRYVADPFIASKAVNYPTGTDAAETSVGGWRAREVTKSEGREREGGRESEREKA